MRESCLLEANQELNQGQLTYLGSHGRTGAVLKKERDIRDIRRFGDGEGIYWDRDKRFHVLGVRGGHLRQLEE